MTPLTKKPRFSAIVKDRETGKVVTLDYNDIHELADDFGRVLRTIADAISLPLHIYEQINGG